MDTINCHLNQISYIQMDPHIAEDIQDIKCIAIYVQIKWSLNCGLWQT